jgi:superfamily I DNA/RNA helicase
MVARLLEEGADPKKILVVTFTRMAAGDLVAKVAACGAPNADQVGPSTLHSLAFQILRHEDAVRALGRVARILLPHERRPMVFDLSRRGFGDVRVLANKEIPAFEAAWARLQSDEPGWPKKEDKALHDALIAWLRFHDAMLVGELVPLALMFMRNNPVNDFSGRYNWVVVDEYQDLNRAEQELIQQLAKKAVLLIAGDDDQSIYAFKYAHPEGIATFPAEVDYPLPVCRRCPSLVLTLARSLIESAGAHRIAKDLQPRAGAPEGEVYVLQWRDVVVESRGLASIVGTWVKAGRFAPGEVLILSPRRVFAEFIHEALTEAGLESRLYYSEQVFDSQKASEAFAVLCLLVDQSDRVALRIWLGLASKEWRAKEYNRLRAECEKRGTDPWTALEGLVTGEIKIPHTKGIVEQFTKLRPRLKEFDNADLQTVVDKALPAGDEDVTELREIAVAALEEADDLLALLRRIRERVAQPEVPTKRTTISIMTPHRAKGLEADLVVLGSCVEGFVPMIDHDAPTEEQDRQMAEGRRLFYVGITRAKKALILSSFRAIPAGAAKRIGFGATKGASGMLRQPASRYLGELGPSCPITVEGDQFIIGLAAAH